MKNPFKRSRKGSRDPQIIMVPLGALAREAVFDTRIADPQTLTALLGMPPMSDDVAEMEDEASRIRVNDLQALYPVISLHADVMADTISKYLAKMDNDAVKDHPALIEDYENFLHGICRPVTVTSCLSLLSVLNAYGLIQIIGANPHLVEDSDE